MCTHNIYFHDKIREKIPVKYFFIFVFSTNRKNYLGTQKKNEFESKFESLSLAVYRRRGKKVF